MALYLYDGSFEGLLSAVFRVFVDKKPPEDLVAEDRCQLGLLAEVRKVETDETLAERVLRTINRKTDDRAGKMVYKMFLSERPAIEMAIFRFIKVIVDSRHVDILGNYANSHIAEAARVEKMIGREVHRMHAFVRFRKSAAGIFHAVVNPDFNVLPLIGEHFVKRYADQPWVIFDTLRHYGLYYDLEGSQFIAPDHPALDFCGDADAEALQDEAESLYQQLWVNYFTAVNIRERKNTKLHLRHMPKRYWGYLVEKKVPL